MDEKTNRSFCSGFMRILKSGDMFGVPITLNYKGSPTFKTAIGGTISYLVYITFAIFSVFLISKMISK